MGGESITLSQQGISVASETINFTETVTDGHFGEQDDVHTEHIQNFSNLMKDVPTVQETVKEVQKKENDKEEEK